MQLLTKYYLHGHVVPTNLKQSSIKLPLLKKNHFSPLDQGEFSKNQQRLTYHVYVLVVDFGYSML